MCLAVLSLEDVEDIYLFGFQIAGFLLLGLCGALVYRKIHTMAARQDAQRLPIMIGDVGRLVSNQTVVSCELTRKVDTILEMLAKSGS